MAKPNKPAAGALRKLPSVDALLEDPDLEIFAAQAGRSVVVNSIREAVNEAREFLITQASAEMDEGAIRQRIVADAKRRLKTAMTPHYRRVVNATGIILHTGLGRAVLPARALRQIQDELSGYSLLQSDTETGKRSKRDGCVEQLLQQLTGAEAATVVNNNAAATSIVLNTVADGREVIVSRGQLVEIGGNSACRTLWPSAGPNSLRSEQPIKRTRVTMSMPLLRIPLQYSAFTRAITKSRDSHRKCRLMSSFR